MRSTIRPARMAAMVTIVMIVLSGCASVGKPATGDATATLQQVQDDYHQAELQTEVTEDALLELYLSPACDIKEAYDAFTENVLRMQRDGEPLVRHADRMHFEGPAYLVESGQSKTACPLPGMAADQQTAELGEYFEAMSDEAWEVKRAWREYEFDVDQIRKYLCQNLSPRTVASMTQMVRKAEVDSASLQDALARVQEAANAAKAAKAAAAPPVSTPVVAPAAPAAPTAPAAPLRPVPPRPGP